MSNYRFPTALKPIVSKGYSYARGSNVFRSEVAGGLPRQGRDTYFEPVPFNIALVVSALGNQTFQSFLTKISGGADSFVMALDSGLGVKDHQCLITSVVNIDTSDGINWNITFTLTAERTDIQEETCLTANLPDLFGCYGDGLNCFLDAYATAQTTFPRIWSDEGPAGYPPINLQALALDSRVAYTGPQISYLNSAGLLATSAANEWPLTFIGGVAVGRVPPEGAAENAVRYSEQLDNTVWDKIRTVITTNATSAPSGAVSADKLVASAVSGAHTVLQSITPAPNTTYTYSVFLKAAEFSSARVLVGQFASQVNPNTVVVDLSAGTITTATDLSRCGISPVGGGWFRIWTTITTNATPTNINTTVQLQDAGGNATFTGDGVSGVHVWGAVLAVASVDSSYIPTTSAAAERSAATAKVAMGGAVSVDVTYSDGSVVNSPAVGGYVDIPQAEAAWGSK